jgi:hypothetical protein
MRYGVISSALVHDPAWITLSAHAKVIYVTCIGFDGCTLAGIFRYHDVAVLVRYSGLSLAETESALAELEKKPTPETSFIVRDSEVLWLRRYLNQHSGLSKANLTHQTAIRNTVNALPADSDVVRKFRKYYKSWWHGPLTGPRRAVDGPSTGRTPTKTKTETETETSTKTETRKEREKKSIGGGSTIPAGEVAAGEAAAACPPDFSLSPESDRAAGTGGQPRNSPPVGPPADDGERAIAVMAEALAARHGNGATPEAYREDARKLLIEEGKYVSGSWSNIASVLLTRWAMDSRP